jgi:Ser/Thr protein kinase RdoA (MazF antagonist)
MKLTDFNITFAPLLIIKPMSHFPVSNSNLSTSHLGLFLQEKYPLSPDTHCRIIRAGVNHTYLVEDGADKFVFRVYSLNWRTEKEISEEIRLLTLLKEKNISVSFPIADKAGNYIQMLNAPEGDRPGVLFSYAKGEKLHSYPPETHYRIGALLGSIHLVTRNLPLDRMVYTPQVLLAEPLEQIKKFLSTDTPEWAFLESARDYITDQLARADTTQLRQGVVHLDIWFDNLNISKEGDVTLFDFDFCGNGWLCLDLAYYILQVHNMEKEEGERKSKTDHFLQGYESVVSITDEERRLVPMLGVCLYIFYLGVQCRRFDNWSNSFLSESYLKRYINVLIKKYYDLYLN